MRRFREDGIVAEGWGGVIVTPVLVEGWFIGNDHRRCSCRRRSRGSRVCDRGRSGFEFGVFVRGGRGRRDRHAGRMGYREDKGRMIKGVRKGSRAFMRFTLAFVRM